MSEVFMRRALEIARTSIAIPGALPYAAVVVKDGMIVGEGLNRALTDFDPTSHAEVEAIRDACIRLRATDLGGADMYTTAEPCAMCVATMHLAGIARVFYAAGAAESSAFIARLAAGDARLVRRLTPAELRAEVGKPIGERRMPAAQMLAAEAQAVFDAFAGRAET